MKQDGSFDALLKQGLLLAALDDAKSQHDANTTDQDFEYSPGYLRKRIKLLADPFRYAKRKLKPVWKKALQSVACFLLAGLIGLATVMTVSPAARAKIVQWFQEIYETYVVHRFAGEDVVKNLPHYEIGALPQGYEEVFRINEPDFVSITYQNADGRQINFSYMRMEQGSAFAAEMSDIEVRDITVNGLIGQLYISQSQEQTSAIIWINEKESTYFALDMFGTAEEILHIAESIF